MIGEVQVLPISACREEAQGPKSVLGNVFRTLIWELESSSGVFVMSYLGRLEGTAAGVKAQGPKKGAVDGRTVERAVASTIGIERAVGGIDELLCIVPSEEPL